MLSRLASHIVLSRSLLGSEAGAILRPAYRAAIPSPTLGVTHSNTSPWRHSCILLAMIATEYTDSSTLWLASTQRAHPGLARGSRAVPLVAILAFLKVRCPRAKRLDRPMRTFVQ